MTLVFWQGIISIHQQSFLQAVAAEAAVVKVLLVVEHDITPYRKEMGWGVPDIAGVEIICSPSKQQIREIVAAHKDAIHIMGGIRVGAMLTMAFACCIKENCRLGIMTEPYNDEGAKGRLRALKYRYYKLRYFKYLQFVLAIGKQGVKQYASLGFDTRRIFPWAYFITVPLAPRAENTSTVKRLIYAGRIDPAKGIYRFTEELVRTKSSNFTFDIYGAGADEGKLKELVEANKMQEQICIHPFLKHTELLQQYGKYDWVVLPSVAKDGWGVIVSEGMLNGLKAICSTICGASRIIKDGENGIVFDWNKQDSCSEAIRALLGGDTFTNAGTIGKWAQATISAEAGAAYFMRIMECVYDNKKKPGIPWE